MTNWHVWNETEVKEIDLQEAGETNLEDDSRDRVTHIEMIDLFLPIYTQLYFTKMVVQKKYI